MCNKIEAVVIVLVVPADVLFVLNYNERRQTRMGKLTRTLPE